LDSLTVTLIAPNFVPRSGGRLNWPRVVALFVGCLGDGEAFVAEPLRTVFDGAVPEASVCDRADEAKIASAMRTITSFGKKVYFISDPARSENYYLDIR
jgi:hypothetical protein